MAWPAREETWGEEREMARQAYADIAAAIAQFEPVSIVAKPRNVAEVSIATGENGEPIRCCRSTISDSCSRPAT